MDNKILNSIQGIAPFIIPIFLLSLSKKGFKLDINLDENYENKAKMIENIRPYFTEDDQKILGKIQDIFDILSRFNRIMKSDYESEVSSVGNAMSLIDKKERILTQMAECMNGNNRQLAESVVKTKQNIFETKANIENYSKSVSSQNIDGLTSMIKLANCIEPIMRESDKKKVRKIEKIVQIINTPDEYI